MNHVFKYLTFLTDQTMLLFSCSVVSNSLWPHGLSLTISGSLPKFMLIASVMPSSHLSLWKWKLLSRVQLFATPWTILSMVWHLLQKDWDRRRRGCQRMRWLDGILLLNSLGHLSVILKFSLILSNQLKPSEQSAEGL